MSRLLAAVDRIADGTIARTRNGSRCLRCGRRILTRRYALAIHRVHGPVQLHVRCAKPLRLTDRGRMVRDLAVCGLAACAVVAICAVIVANWPALAALMRQP